MPEAEIVSASDCARASELLRAAEHVLSISFYDSKYENKPAELNCRIFGLSPLTEADLKMFASRLNSAIEPVKKELAAMVQKEAMDRLTRATD